MTQRRGAGTFEQWVIATGPWKQPEEFKHPPPKSNQKTKTTLITIQTNQFGHFHIGFLFDPTSRL